MLLDNLVHLGQLTTCINMWIFLFRHLQRYHSWKSRCKVGKHKRLGKCQTATQGSSCYAYKISKVNLKIECFISGRIFKLQYFELINFHLCSLYRYFTGLLTPWKGILLFGPPGTGKVRGACSSLFCSLFSGSNCELNSELISIPMSFKFVIT